jgi:hypothetical protein
MFIHVSSVFEKGVMVGAKVVMVVVSMKRMTNVIATLQHRNILIEDEGSRRRNTFTT